MSVLKVFRLGALALALGLTPTLSHAESLADAMAYAYANNPSLASSFLTVRSAQQGIRSAEGARLPTIGGEASVGYTWSDVPGRTAPNDSLGLSYSQTLFDSSTDDAILRAQAEYDAAVQGARNVEQNVLLSVAQAYVNVVTNRRIVDIRQENIGFVRAQLQSARDRLELGEGTQLDVAQAQASLAQAEAAYQGAINNLRQAEANYVRWVGHEPRGLSASYRFGNLLPGSLDSAIAAATTNHPALLASAAQIRAAQHGYNETVAGFGPTISFTGQAGLGGFSTNTIASQASVSLRLSVPIFVPARDPAVERANIGQIQTQVEGIATRDQITEAVRQGWAGIQATTAQIESATAAVAASRLALQAVIDQNEVGQATTLDVLNARASLLNAEEALASAQAQRAIASYSLIAATGALSAANLGLPVQLRGADGTVAEPVRVPEAPADVWGNLR
ncbi:TolC family outer membrane protein [Pelagibacterium sediminicola]|uniref:TolC family outer membrane protein n=1 Tax=Pelagibacterium sediminicola TaxID=2248761 RepID=UPI000E311B7E|nr:TolC family outer membrane protein [Pelagibacterium sediminicola]